MRSKAGFPRRDSADYRPSRPTIIYSHVPHRRPSWCICARLSASVGNSTHRGNPALAGVRCDIYRLMASVGLYDVDLTHPKKTFIYCCESGKIAFNFEFKSRVNRSEPCSYSPTKSQLFRTFCSYSPLYTPLPNALTKSTPHKPRHVTSHPRS